MKSQYPGDMNNGYIQGAFFSSVGLKDQKIMLRSIVVLLQLAATAATLPTTRWFSQSLDHFDPSDDTRWQHRYLTNADHWDGSGALPNG